MEALNDFLVKIRLRRITKESILYFYYPLKGVTCYVVFGGHVMNPAILSSWPLIPKSIPPSNLALLNANVGLACYLFGSRHLKHLHTCRRATFSIFGSVMFNMGSVLTFAILKQVTPECNTFRGLIGMASAVGLIIVAKSYVDELDRQAVIHDVESTE